MAPFGTVVTAFGASKGAGVRASAIATYIEPRQRAQQRLKLPCFRLGERVGVLPAFGGFTGLAAYVPRPGERVFAVAEKSVIEVSGG